MTFQEVLSRIAEGVRGESDLDAILVPVADLRVILTALSTPPADDVREALGDAIHNAMNTKFDIGFISDAILADFEVHPRGTVTDTECVEVADRALEATGILIWPRTVRAVLEAARGVRS